MTASVSLTVGPQAAPATQPELRKAEPCTMVIFGAGDLVHRKLMPSLFHLMGDGLLPADFAVISVARAEGSDESFRSEVGNSLRAFAPDGGVDQMAWRRFAPHLHYLTGELDDPATYAALDRRIREIDAAIPGANGHLFYLAIPPSL